MSLNVPTALLDAAESGEIDDAMFIGFVRTSLPYAWQTISHLVAELRIDDADYADNLIAPPGEAERGQLLRALASDAIRAGLERHFDVKLAFQNGHRVAAFRPSAAFGPTYQRFVSPWSQLLNQSPELRDR